MKRERQRVSQESQERIVLLSTHIRSAKESRDAADLDRYLQEVSKTIFEIFGQAGIKVKSASAIKKILLENTAGSTQEFVNQISLEKYDDKLRTRLRTQGIDATIIAEVNEAFELAGQRSESSRSSGEIIEGAMVQLGKSIDDIKSKSLVVEQDLDDLSKKIYQVLTIISQQSNRTGMGGVTYKSPAQIKEILLTQKFYTMPSFLQAIVSIGGAKYQECRPHITNAVTMDAGFNTELFKKIAGIVEPFGHYPQAKMAREEWLAVTENLISIIKETKESGDPLIRDQNLGKISDILFRIFSEAGNPFSVSEIKNKLLVTKVDMVTELVRQIHGSDDERVRQDIVYKGITADIARSIGEVFGLAGQHTNYLNPNDFIRIAIKSLEDELKYNESKTPTPADLERIAGAVYDTLAKIFLHTQNSDIKASKLKSFGEVRKALLDKQFPQLVDFVTESLISNEPGAVSSAFSKYGLTLDVVQKISKIFEPFGNRKEKELKPDEIIKRARDQLQDSLVGAEKAAVSRESNPEGFNSALEKTANDFSVFIQELIKYKTGMLNGINLIEMQSKAEIETMLLTKDIKSGYDLCRALINDMDAQKPVLKGISTSLGRCDINSDFTTRITQVFKFSDRYNLAEVTTTSNIDPLDAGVITTSSAETQDKKISRNEDRDELGSLGSIDSTTLDDVMELFEVFKDDASKRGFFETEVKPESPSTTTTTRKRDSATQLQQPVSKETRLLS